MFRKVLGSLACTAVLASANSNVKAEVAGAAKVVAKAVTGTTGGIFAINSVVNILQWFAVAEHKEGNDNNGVLGFKGALGQFDHPWFFKGEDGSLKGLVFPIVKGISGFGLLGTAFIV